MSRRGGREGSIYKRASDDRWVGAVTIGAGERKIIYGPTRRAVADKVTTLVKAQQDGIALRSSDRLTVNTFLGKWIEGARSTVRASTWDRYSALVRKHLVPRLGRIALSKLQPADCAAAFAEMIEAGQAPRSVIQARAVLARALREAEISGLVARNAARLTRAPRLPRAEMRTLSREEVRTLLEAAQGERLAALFHVAIASGAREGELLALRWSDVDQARGAIRIARTLQRTSAGLSFAECKTRSSARTVPLGPSAMEVLRAHRVRQAEERLRNGLGKATEDGLVFTTEIGTPLDAGNLLANVYYPLLRRAGLARLTFHGLRHTSATLALEEGVHPRSVAERLGHATPSLVMNTYGHVTERMQEQATAALERVMTG